MKRQILFLLFIVASIVGCTDSSVEPTHPAAKRIFFTPIVDSARNLYIASIEADGSGLRRVLDGAALMDAPAHGWLVAGLASDIFSTRSVRTDGTEPHDFGRLGTPHLSPSGRTIIFADMNKTRQASVTGGAATLIDTSDCPCSVKFTEDDRYILYASHGALRVMDTKMKQKWSVEEDSLLTSRAHGWSPYGSQVAFLADSEGTGTRTLFVVDRSGKNLHAVYGSPRGGSQAGLAWSPDGSLIAFADGNRIALIDPDGTGYRVLVDGTSDVADFTELQWGPDGRALLYTRITHGGYKLEVVALATGAITVLNDNVVKGYWER